MSRIFCYLRLSPSEPEITEQLATIKNENYIIDDSAAVSETVCGHIPSIKRNKFQALIQKTLSAGDILVVVKIDSLGCNAADILRTIKQLVKLRVHLYVVELTPVDLTSNNAEPFLATLLAIADMECAHSVEACREQIEYYITSHKRLVS